MSASEFTILHIVHVAAALMLVGLTFFAFAADPAYRKATLAWGGIASLLVLASGFRMWWGQFAHVLAGWIVVKFLCWLLISALTGIGFRRRGQPGLLAAVTILAAALAVAMVYLKPF